MTIVNFPIKQKRQAVSPIEEDLHRSMDRMARIKSDMRDEALSIGDRNAVAQMYLSRKANEATSRTEIMAAKVFLFAFLVGASAIFLHFFN